MLQICQNIKQARLSAKLSQEDLAKKLGVNRTTYQNWEKNTEPDLSTIVAIANNLGIAPIELLRGVIDLEGKEKSGAGPDLIKQKQLSEAKESLRKLALVVGTLAGLSKDEAMNLLVTPLDTRAVPGIDKIIQKGESTAFQDWTVKEQKKGRNQK